MILELKLQVETVPPEDEMPFTTTPDPIQTNLRQLEKDMKATADPPIHTKSTLPHHSAAAIGKFLSH